MRGLVIGIVLVVVLAALAGWISFSSPGGDPTLQIDSERVREDANEMVEKAKETADDVDRHVDIDIKKD